MFLRTLGISDKTCRTSLKKDSKIIGVLEKENRGGRHECQATKDRAIRKSITVFPVLSYFRFQ
nr:unnamed protein product [Callosobruchus chinensis]